jgi:hypothetical protein
MRTKKSGGCACGGRRHSVKKHGGTLVGDAILAGTALGLYSYFTKKSGGRKARGSRTRSRVASGGAAKLPRRRGDRRLH